MEPFSTYGNPRVPPPPTGTPKSLRHLPPTTHDARRQAQQDRGQAAYMHSTAAPLKSNLENGRASAPGFGGEWGMGMRGGWGDGGMVDGDVLSVMYPVYQNDSSKT